MSRMSLDESNFDPHTKKTEIALLFEDLCKLHEKGQLLLNPELQPQLQAEASRRRIRPQHSVLTPDLRKAAQELRDNDDIVIRRADKSSIFVILDKEDYHSKVRSVLQDSAKFKRISRDTTATLKTRVNKLIDAANAEVDGIHLQKVTGECGPGYLYGNVKTHKPGQPIRPIISQIPTPTYRVAKQLNAIISPYIPTEHSVQSTDEFVDILRSQKPKGALASLDVESLFTNVPVQQTIEIILEYVYNNQTIRPPKLPKRVLEQLLLSCTTEAPFRCPEGKLYVQVDGVAMGSPLGVLFAQAYMSYVESKVLLCEEVRPFMYYRYVDDIFVDAENADKLDLLRMKLEQESVLNFTVDHSVGQKLPFLDVMIDCSSGDFITDVYRKPTDLGRCMNGEGDVTDSYKSGVVRAYIRRALKNCSNWDLLHAELERVRKILVDNGYSNSIFDHNVKTMLQNHVTKQGPQTKKGDLKVFYRNTMSPTWKTDEQIIRGIVRRNCHPTDQEQRLVVQIYYTSPKTSQLVMKNNSTRSKSALKQTNVVYQFQCTAGDCATREVYYIGHTTTSLSRRLTMHLQDGAPKKHYTEQHNTALTRDDLVTNTSILAHCQDRRRLITLETVYIRDRKPIINIQTKQNTSLSLYDKVLAAG